MRKNRNKSAILNFEIWELVRKLVICNMHNKFGKDKNFLSYHTHKVKLLAKNRNKSAILIFFFSYHQTCLRTAY